MTSYAGMAYYDCIQGVLSMIEYEEYVQKELEKTIPTEISKIILEYYDIHSEHKYCSG